MDEVAGLLAGYPFDVLLGSVHWLGAWRFDVLERAAGRWRSGTVRDVDAVLGRVHPGHGGAGGVRVVRRPRPPRPGQGGGPRPGRPRRVLRPDHRGRGAVGHGRRGVLGRMAQAGRRGVPGAAAARAASSDRGVPLTTASDAHSLARRGRPGRRPAGPADRGRGRPPCRAIRRPPRPYDVARSAAARRARPERGHPGRAGLRAHRPRRRGSSATSSACSGTWGILADLSFSDLVLLAPMAPGPARTGTPTDPELVVLGQMRPSNSATVVEHDLVGQTVTESPSGPWPPCLTPARSSRGEVHPRPGTSRSAPLHPGAVRGRPSSPCWPGCPPAPASGPGAPRAHLPRRLRPLRHHAGRVDLPVPERGGRPPRRRPGSATASSWSTRRGGSATPRPTPPTPSTAWACTRQTEGRRLTDLGIEESAIEWALASALPGGRGGGAAAGRHRAAPLHPPAGQRRGDRVPGPAARRHRRPPARPPAPVQGRRHPRGAPPGQEQPPDHLGAPAAAGPPAAPGGGRVALFEAERRVRSIAIVHEILSREPSDQVPFDEIVTSLIRMAEDSVVSAQPIVISR